MDEYIESISNVFIATSPRAPPPHKFWTFAIVLDKKQNKGLLTSFTHFRSASAAGNLLPSSGNKNNLF